MTIYFDTLETPYGGLAPAVDEQQRVVQIVFLADQTSAEEALARGFHGGAEELVVDRRRVARVSDQLQEYFARRRKSFELELAPRGSAVQKLVWQQLSRIPWGQTRSYSQIAAALGKPGAARAVGRANATNPIPIVVPCHRVIGRDGSLTGFAGGLRFKEGLLALEGRTLF